MLLQGSLHMYCGHEMSSIVQGRTVNRKCNLGEENNVVYTDNFLDELELRKLGELKILKGLSFNSHSGCKL